MNFDMQLMLKRGLAAGAAALLALSLSACGNTAGERALSGGALGAGVGALGAAATGGNAGTGALIGGGVGAAAGALTTPRYDRYGHRY